MKTRSIFVAIALFLSSVAFAQSGKGITVTGTVLDSKTSEPVFGYVQLKGSETKVYAEISILDGSYSITVPANGVLTVEASGYAKKEIAVEGKTVINFSLDVDTQMLEAAVSIGYGSAKKVGNIVGSISTVSSEVVKNAPAVSALDLLQGQVAGMQVLSTGGVAGDNNISMKIHGVGSLGTSSEPLFIVDGAQSSSSAVMAMNPNDIANVTVLKDASATSIYGSQGANGVVYITTKGGQFDNRATIKVSSQYGISTLANRQFYDNMMSGDELKSFWIRSGIMTADQIYRNYTQKGYTHNTKWHEVLQRFNTPQYQNDLTIEGGSSKVAYLVGASQFHQVGSTYGNYFDRYTIRTNVQARPVDWLKFGVNLNGAITKDQSNESWGNSSEGSNYVDGGLSFTLNPLLPHTDENGKELMQYPNGVWNQQYYNEVGYRNDFSLFRATGSAFMEIEPVKHLIFTSRVGTDSYVEFMDRYLLPSALFGSGTGMVQKSAYKSSKNTITNTLEYSFNLGSDHSFSILGGQEGIAYIYDSFISFSNGQTDDRLLTLQDGLKDKFQVQQSKSQYRFFSLFGHADYNYKEKYFVDFTLRDDASSRFGKDVRHALFWASGLMWKLGNEDFMREIGFINSLNVKASYGTQGNANIGNYRPIGLISTSSKYHTQTSLMVTQPSNSMLTWEKQSLLTVGFDAKLFDNFTVEMDVYNRVTTDMLMSVPFPYTSGFTSAYSNVGAMKNSGIDITLGYDFINTRNAYLNGHFTFNYNREKVTSLFNGLDRWEIANTGIAYVVGKPVMFYDVIYAGVDPEDGLPMWYLPGEDKDVCTMDPERVTKEYDADALTQNTGLLRHEPVNGGFGFNARLHNFTLNADFAFVLGKTLINNDMYFYVNPAKFSDSNQIKDVSDFWTPYNTDAKYPDWSKGVGMQFDTHLYEDASFMRLKTLQIGYDIPVKALGIQNVVKGAMVSLIGRNLLTFTNYTGMDPEVDSNLTIGIPGNTKQMLVGLEIKF